MAAFWRYTPYTINIQWIIMFKLKWILVGATHYKSVLRAEINRNKEIWFGKILLWKIPKHSQFLWACPSTMTSALESHVSLSKICKNSLINSYTTSGLHLLQLTGRHEKVFKKKKKNPTFTWMNQQNSMQCMRLHVQCECVREQISTLVNSGRRLEGRPTRMSLKPRGSVCEKHNKLLAFANDSLAGLSIIQSTVSTHTQRW